MVDMIRAVFLLICRLNAPNLTEVSSYCSLYYIHAIKEAQQEKTIELYRSFPPDSDFKVPQYIQGEVKWGTIQDIGGQKHRVAGYMIDNVFYVVFLDKNHKFWKMKK